MTNSVTTTVTFSFSDNADSGSLSLENWNGFVGMGSVALTLVDEAPGPPPTLYTTVGTIEDFNMVLQKPKVAYFTEVNGVNYCNIPATATFTVLFALDHLGNPIPVPPQLGRVKDTVTFAGRFWGLVKVDAHNQPVKVLKYTPHKNLTIWTYGVVAAYKNGQMALCHVQPPAIGTGNDELEIYRVESEVLINGEGEWEKPLGWPDNPSYPNGAAPPRPKVGVISTRVHEVGMVTSTGFFYSRAFDIPIQKPYFGDRNYQPTTNVVQGSGFSKLTPEMKVKAKEAIVARGKGQYL